MPPLLVFLIRRLLAIPVTLFIITLILYASAMLTNAETRAEIYMPRSGAWMTTEARANMIQDIIRRKGLDQPFPVQYGNWLVSLLRGDWGYSPTMQEDMLPALVRRTPATLELTLYALLLFLPLGIISGVIAAWRKEQGVDAILRLGAFVGTAIPPFVLALVLLALFYVALNWFPPNRISTSYRIEINADDFRQFTGLLTVDSLLNGRTDIFVDAARHLVLPVITLSLAQWATILRVMRISTVEVLDTEYLMAARARGVSERGQVWKHAFRNALVPALTSSILSAASLVTGVYVVERIFNIPGISEVITRALEQGIGGLAPSDIVSGLGFAIYSSLIILPLMTVLELAQAAIDPRIRQGATA